MNGSGSLGAGLGGAGSAMPKSFYTPVYHASPHLFNKFDISKIGTGQGESAMGKGLYYSLEKNYPKQFAKQWFRDAPDGKPSSYYYYKAELPYSQEQLLDSSKVVSKQSKSVQKALDPLIKQMYQTGEDPARIEMLKKGIKANDIYRNLISSHGEDEAAKIMREAGIPGVIYEKSDKKSTVKNVVMFKDEGTHIANSQKINPNTFEEAKIKIPSSGVFPKAAEAIKEIPQNIARIGRYYAQNPAEAAKGLGKGGAMAAVGAGVEYGLQKLIPKTQGSNYYQEVYNNLRDLGISGASGGVAGPLGASIGIASELAGKTYNVGKDATDLIKSKINAIQAREDIERKKKKSI